MTCANPESCARQKLFPVRDYDLAATLSSGQTFRWTRIEGGWEGVLGKRWVRLSPAGSESRTLTQARSSRPESTEAAEKLFEADIPGQAPAAHRQDEETAETDSAQFIHAQTAEDMADWTWLADFLQVELDLSEVLAGFPCDEPLRAAVSACRGLRLLRQDPWECLASFILSSTKQIVQIQQIIGLLCQRYGETVAVPPGHRPVQSFPTAAALAQLSEAELRTCKMGFRAAYLRETAVAVSRGEIDLSCLARRTVEDARTELLRLPGVGRKIADCVLLFACGFQEAFPVDVWVTRALRDLYFPRKRVDAKRLQRFSQTHFGPYAGYAQQYLFHYMRIVRRAAAGPLDLPLARPAPRAGALKPRAR